MISPIITECRRQAASRNRRAKREAFSKAVLLLIISYLIFLMSL